MSDTQTPGFETGWLGQPSADCAAAGEPHALAEPRVPVRQRAPVAPVE